MAKDLDNVRIYDGEAGGVWVAPKGTTGPTDLTAPPAGFEELGWISQDGISESAEINAETFRAWQGAKVLRRKITQNDRTFSFQCMEENATIHGLKYRGQAPVVSTGVATTTVTEQTANDTRAWVMDMYDGDIQKRFVIPAGEYEQTGTIQYRNAPTIHEYSVTPIGDYFEITDDPAIAVT